MADFRLWVVDLMFRLWWLGLVFSVAFAIFACHENEYSLIEAIAYLVLIPLGYMAVTRTSYWLLTGR